MNRNEHRSPEGRNTHNSGHISDIQEHEENEDRSVEEDTPAQLDHRPSLRPGHPSQSHSHLQPPRDHGRLSVSDDNNTSNNSSNSQTNNHSSNNTQYSNGSPAGGSRSPNKRLDKDGQRQTSPKTPLRLSTSMIGASSSAFHIHDNPMSAVLPKMPVLFNNGSSSSSFVDTMTQQLSIHVEQPVGSMSISPSSRDVVLAA